MATKKFEFTHKGERYEVMGEFGNGEKRFLVTRLQPVGKRAMGTSGGPPSGIRIEKVVTAKDENDLAEQLQSSFPGFTDFRSS